ncbi:syntaxin 1B/2/3 [Rhodotorula toruloides]|uniref:Syntaxin 1B/2/3 n=1 Tax=Rhodotorula toruloides TaxID=5286 RepID=A0A511KR70_RHOTO|nr:syntaxin 1B/2/3 [Rhodotorula toruloides]
MARDRLAAIRPSKAQRYAQPPSAPEQSSRGAMPALSATPYYAFEPQDFNPLAAEQEQPQRDKPRGLAGWNADFSADRQQFRRRRKARRQYGSRDENAPPPVPSYDAGPPIDFASAPVSPDVAQYVNTLPDVAPPRDFDPNDSRSHYATNYSPSYMTPPQQSRHETHSVKRSEGTVSKGEVPFEEMGEFFQAVSDLQQAVREANGSIQAIGNLHSRILSMPSSEDAMAIELKSQLDAKTATTRALFTSIKNQLQVLQQGNANLRAMIPLGQSLYNLSLQDIEVRDQQVGALKERFKDAIQRYTEEEKQNRAKQRARLERQVKVVNPNLDPAELQEIVKKAEEGDGAMFAHAFQTNSYRSQAARGALREVQNRAAALARIEQTLIELAQLFQDMAVMVEAQDVAIVKIEQNAISTEMDTEKGLENVQKAVVHARNYRKYRWWCFGFIVVIIIIVLIVLCVELIPPAIRAAQNDRNARQSRSSASAAQAARTSPAVQSLVASSAIPTTTASTTAAPVSTGAASGSSSPSQSASQSSSGSVFFGYSVVRLRHSIVDVDFLRLE